MLRHISEEGVLVRTSAWNVTCSLCWVGCASPWVTVCTLLSTGYAAVWLQVFQLQCGWRPAAAPTLSGLSGLS